MENHLGLPPTRWPQHIGSLENSQTPLLASAAPPQTEDASHALPNSNQAAKYQLNAVLLTRRHWYILFDVFLEHCDEETRSEVAQSGNRPIHIIHMDRGVYRIRRNAGLDESVARRYAAVRDIEYRGSRPYFIDLENPPPLYDEEDEYDEDDEDDEEGEDDEILESQFP